eukprot:5410277-Alexandrium_andersonii.AAC.1
MAYAVWRLNSALGHFGSWCEGCPCHSHSSELLPASRWKRQHAFTANAGAAAVGAPLLFCPVKGARAPEMACGDHIKDALPICKCGFPNHSLLALVVVVCDFASVRKRLQAWLPPQTWLSG